jgi:hypothetical protein
MNVNGAYFTLLDLSRDKITTKTNLQRSLNDTLTSPDILNIFEISEQLLQKRPENIIYIDNINSNPIDIYNDGYIFSGLPYPYDYVLDNNNEYYIDIVFPTIENDLSLPKISDPNPYIEREMEIERKREIERNRERRNKSPYINPVRSGPRSVELAPGPFFMQNNGAPGPNIGKKELR